MKYTRELKVGVSIIVAAFLFFIGVRYFQDVPILRGTYVLHTDFANAQGLTSGNVVRVQGVNVGAVEDVRLDVETNRVRVRFHVDRGVSIPEGSVAEIAGIAALSGVRLDLVLGPRSNRSLEQGSYVRSSERSGMSDLTARAPALMDRTEEALMSVSATFARMETLLQNAEPELAGVLRSTRNASDALEVTLRSQQARLSATIENLEAFSGDLRTITHDNRDSLQVLVASMNTSFTRLNDNLSELQTATGSLNAILAGVQSGDGTVGRLVSDPELYERLDSTISAINRLVTDFQNDPGRYLREMRLIDIF